MLLTMLGSVIMSKVDALMCVILSWAEMYSIIDEFHTSQSHYNQIQLYFSIHLNWIQSLGRWRQYVFPKVWNIQPPRGAQTPKNTDNIQKLVIYRAEKM